VQGMHGRGPAALTCRRMASASGYLPNVVRLDGSRSSLSDEKMDWPRDRRRQIHFAFTNRFVAPSHRQTPTLHPFGAQWLSNGRLTLPQLEWAESGGLISSDARERRGCYAVAPAAASSLRTPGPTTDGTRKPIAKAQAKRSVTVLRSFRHS
jgi:hypothetical protein